MSQPLRIMFVITDLQLGGTPRMLRDLAVGLKASGEFLPSVVSLKSLKPKEENVAGALQQGGVPVRMLHMESWRDSWRGLAGLVRALRDERERPDVVVSMLVHANALATAALAFVSPRPKFVQSIQTMQEQPAWHWRVAGLASKYADAIVTPAQPILDRMKNFGEINQGLVIPNGIDVDRFAYAKPFLPQELPWPNGSRVIGYLGRLDRVKNLPLLLFSLAKLAKKPFLRPWVLAFVGYGEQEKELKILSTRLHLAPSVHFLGPTTVPERWYKSFTCHCLPSTVEGFGLTLAESIAAGTPVVAIRTPITEKIVRDGYDGLLIDRPDATLLSQALQAVIVERETARLGSVPPPNDPMSGQATMRRKFSVERMVGRWGNFLKNL